VLQTAKAVVMVTHDMSWITAFCNRAVLLEKGKIVADGDPDEIADMHEQDAAKRAKQKRKAKQLMLHGVASQDEIKQARKEGTLDDMIEDKTGEVEEIKAEKRRQVEEKRARRKARKAQAARAESTAGNGSAGEPPAEPKAETAEPEAVAASAKSDQGDPGTSGRS
jgi:ABC-type multidrug transport system ATPase subunit